MALNDFNAFSKQLAVRWSTATDVLMSASSIRRHLLYHGVRGRVPLYMIPLRQTIDDCVCNGLMNTETGKLVDTKLSFQMNQTSIGGAMMSTFMLDAIPVNADFQSAFSNDSVAKRPETWSEVRFHITDGQVYYKLRVISIATGTSVKCYNLKSFPSFKTSIKLPFNRIMRAHILQKLFETSVQQNICSFFFNLLIRWICRLLSTCGIWLVGVSLLIHVLHLQKMKFGCAYKQYVITADIQNLFDSMPRRIAVLITACIGYTKY